MALKALCYSLYSWFWRPIPQFAAGPAKAEKRLSSAILGRMYLGLWAVFAFIGCTRSPETDLGRQASTRKEATALLARDTQRIAKRRQMTWLSTEPLLSWTKTPVTLRLASHQAVTRSESEQLARDILHSMLWSCNSQRSIKAFVNHELKKQENRPIEWDDLALKISFWSQEGERYGPSHVAQLVVQKGMITTWSADPKTQRLTDPMTKPLTAPSFENSSTG